MERRDHGKGGQPLLLPRLFLLATCFLAGVFLGQFIAGRLPETIGTELNAYLERYFQVSRESLQKAFFSVVLLYFRYPLMVVLLGFASVGVALIPGITVAVGFFLSYSVSCFVAAFGAHGAILAVAAMGFRCLFTIPCYFILAVPAWRRSAALTGLSFGRGRRGSLDVYGRSWWSLVILCLFVLLIGACLDLYCTPGLLKWALNQTLF